MYLLRRKFRPTLPSIILIFDFWVFSPELTLQKRIGIEGLKECCSRHTKVAGQFVDFLYYFFALQAQVAYVPLTLLAFFAGLPSTRIACTSCCSGV